MIYPIYTYSDGTEVTASKPDVDGKVSLYIEKFDAQKDTFLNATIVLPDVYVKSSSGYSENELEEMRKRISEIRDDIMEHVKERSKSTQN